MPNDQEVALKITKLIPVGIDTLGIYSAILNALKKAREPLIKEIESIKEVSAQHCSDAAKLEKENEELRKELDFFKNSWGKVAEKKMGQQIEEICRLSEQVGRLEERLKELIEVANKCFSGRELNLRACADLQEHIKELEAALVREG